MIIHEVKWELELFLHVLYVDNILLIENNVPILSSGKIDWETWKGMQSILDFESM